MRQSFSRIITDRARSSPDEPVVVDADGEMTASDLDERATAFARVLRQDGVARDDTVTVALPNSREFVIACVAIWRTGAIPQPVRPTLTPDERGAVDRLVRPVAAIGVRPTASGITWHPSTSARPALPASPPLPDLFASSWKAVTTSGSTGSPKVVRARGPALLDPTLPVAPFLPRRAVQLVSGPLWHSASFTYAFRGLLTGHRLIVLPRFEERAWIDAVQRHRATWALIVPTMMHRIMRLPAHERDPARVATLESLVHLGAPCDVDLKRRFIDWLGGRASGGDRLVEVYAGSESNGLTMIRGDEWLAHPGSVGRGIGGTRVQIRTSTGEPARIGDVGEVWMRRGDVPAYDYVGAPSRRDAAGWDTLGDLGRLDGDGYLYLADRADDVINRGGEKIYPVEVERVLEGHSRVRSAVAFGVPDDELGQRVEAVVDVADARLDAQEMRAWARARLGARAPHRILIVHEPVRDDAGKTSRRNWAQLTRDESRGITRSV